ISLDQRPGPCWIDIPMNIQSSFIEEDEFLHFTPETKTTETKDTICKNLDEVASDIIAELSAAQRPVIWLGHGIKLAGGEQLITELMDKIPAALLISWAGIDMVDSDHPLLFGRAGVYGQRCANFVLQNCDYLLSIGTRLAIPQIGYDITEL